MGVFGVSVLGHLISLGILPTLMSSGFMLNMSYRVGSILIAMVNKVELHADGKSVTLHSSLGKTQTVNISAISKGMHEKELVQTFEEAYLFPIAVNGQTYYLHGQGYESVKHGEAFRAILNGQAINLSN